MIKLVNTEFPEAADEVSISKVTVEYTQDLDCCQSERDYPEGFQKLTITTDDGGDGKFIRFNTGKSGWSVDADSIEDVTKILSDFKQRITCES